MKCSLTVMALVFGAFASTAAQGVELMVTGENETQVSIEVRLGAGDQLAALAVHGRATGLALPESFEGSSTTTIAGSLEDGALLLLLGSTDSRLSLQPIPGAEATLARGILLKTGETWTLTVLSYDQMRSGEGAQFAVMGMPATQEPEGTPIAAFNPAFEAFPNPACSEFQFSFASGRQNVATVRIYDSQGRLVREIGKGDRRAQEGAAGLHWDGRSDAGDVVASGVYFAQVKYTVGAGASKKLVLVR